MSPQELVCADATPSLCDDVMTDVRTREYLSIHEMAHLLEKSLSRVYQMAAEGLFTDAGLDVVRRKNGRIWIAITRYGHSRLSSMEQKGAP
jgi:hypothetical protein